MRMRACNVPAAGTIAAVFDWVNPTGHLEGPSGTDVYGEPTEQGIELSTKRESQAFNQMVWPSRVHFTARGRAVLL